MATEAVPLGSSPLARGALVDGCFAAGDVGLIPAGAGSTTPTRTRPKPPRAHPRWRGEHDLRLVTDRLDTGSSPLARGARWGCGADASASGLIPAGAGSTSRVPSAAPSIRAHPRWCGEHLTNRQIRAGCKGSSPLARGARGTDRKPAAYDGLIPAGAGSTRSPHWPRRWPRAHPRWRGEHCGR